MTKPNLLWPLPFLKGSGPLQILHSCQILINGLIGLPDCQKSFKATVEFPYRSRFLRVTHRSRSAAVTARKEVGNKFYLGNSTTLIFGESSQIPKALSTVDPLRGNLKEAWQSTPFNAASTANKACNGQLALKYRNASFLISQNTKLNPKTNIAESAIAKAALPTMSIGDSCKSCGSGSVEKIAIPPIVNGTTVKECAKRKPSKSFQPSLNDTLVINAIGIDISTSPTVLNKVRLRKSGLLADRNAIAAPMVLSRNVQMRSSVLKLMTEAPLEVMLREISHRSRSAVVAARKEVVKQFYRGVSVTLISSASFNLGVIGGLNG